MPSWEMDTDPGVVNGGLEQQCLQERNKKKDSKGQEGGRKDLCFLSSKKLLYIKKIGPALDYSISGTLYKGSWCITAALY